jgi:nucleoside-diphosphate-sugar epimerase
MKIMVTGGAGFIGSALVHHLVASGSDEVLVLDCFTCGSSRLAGSVARPARFSCHPSGYPAGA